MKKSIPFVVAFALFMQTLDSTIISTAIPTIALSLNTNPINLKLALTSYLFSLAIFIPISGWLADQYGTKQMFIIALLLFTLGSFFCGISHNLTQLVLSRIVQGTGGAFMMPTARLILLRSFAKSELMQVTNYATIPSLMGPAIGPVLGGIIVSYVSWRWIFFVNIPFGLLGSLMAYRMLKSHFSPHEHRLDWLGFILFGLGLAMIAIGIGAIGEVGHALTWPLSAIVAGIFFLGMYFIHARYTKYPFLNMRLFKIPTFSITVIGSFFSRCGIGGMSFLMPLFFQLSLNKSALHSGYLLFFYAAGMMAMKFFITQRLQLWGFKNLLIGNTLLLGLSIWLFCGIGLESSLYLIIATVFLIGLLTSLQFSCLNVLAFLDLDEHNMSEGVSIATAFQQLAMSFGIAIGALILTSYVGYESNPFEIKQHIFHNTFFVMGAFTILSSAPFFFLDKKAGRQVSTRQIELSNATMVKESKK